MERIKQRCVDIMPPDFLLRPQIRWARSIPALNQQNFLRMVFPTNVSVRTHMEEFRKISNDPMASTKLSSLFQAKDCLFARHYVFFTIYGSN